VTINLTDVTFDLLVAEQLHDIVPCDDADCDRTAHWHYTHKCGSQWFGCDIHRGKHDELVASAKASGRYFRPNCCGGPVPVPTPWVAL